MSITLNLEEALAWFRLRIPECLALEPEVYEGNIAKAADLAHLLQLTGNSSQANTLLNTIVRRYDEMYARGAANYPLGIAINKWDPAFVWMRDENLNPVDDILLITFLMMVFEMLNRLVFIVFLTSCCLFAGEPVFADGSPVFVVHFSTGPNWHADKPPNEQQGFAEHSANLRRLRQEGVILFGARYESLGMIFLASESEQTARAALDSDPGVEAGIFVYRIAAMNIFYPWKEPGPVPTGD